MNQAQFLAAIIANSPRVPVYALITNIYPILINENPTLGSLSISKLKSYKVIVTPESMQGTVSITSILWAAIPQVEYNENENGVTGSVSISEVIQTRFTILDEASLENGVIGSVSISEIIQVTVLVSSESRENEVVGSVSISAITQTN